jgi:hypothetical protein
MPTDLDNDEHLSDNINNAPHHSHNEFDDDDGQYGWFNPRAIVMTMVSGMAVNFTQTFVSKILNIISNIIFMCFLKFIGYFGYKYYKCSNTARLFMYVLKSIDQKIKQNPKYVTFKTGEHSITGEDVISTGLFTIKDDDGSFMMAYIDTCDDEEQTSIVDSYERSSLEVMPKNIYVISKKSILEMIEQKNVDRKTFDNMTSQLVHIHQHILSHEDSASRYSVYNSKISNNITVGTNVNVNLTKVKVIDYYSPKQKTILEDIIRKKELYNTKNAVFKSQIILICGQPGVGKTYTSHLLTYHTNSIEIMVKNDSYLELDLLIQNFTSAKIPLVINWDEFDTFLDNFVVNEENIKKPLKKKKKSKNKTLKKIEKMINDDDSEDEDLLMSDDSDGNVRMGGRYGVIKTDHQKIKKQLADLFDTIYQYDNVILVLTTNKPKTYFVDNRDLDFLTRSMRIHKIYELVSNSVEENKIIFKDFLKIFAVDGWDDSNEQLIKWENVKISDIYHLFNFSFADSKRLFANLKELNLITNNN